MKEFCMQAKKNVWFWRLKLIFLPIGLQPLLQFFFNLIKSYFWNNVLIECLLIVLRIISGDAHNAPLSSLSVGAYEINIHIKDLIVCV